MGSSCRRSIGYNMAQTGDNKMMGKERREKTRTKPTGDEGSQAKGEHAEESTEEGHEETSAGDARDDTRGGNASSAVLLGGAGGRSRRVRGGSSGRGLGSRHACRSGGASSRGGGNGSGSSSGHTGGSAVNLSLDSAVEGTGHAIESELGRVGGEGEGRVRGVLVGQGGELDEPHVAVASDSGIRGVGHKGVGANVGGGTDVLQASLSLDTTGAKVDRAGTDGSEDGYIAVVVPADVASDASSARSACGGFGDVDGGRGSRDEGSKESSGGGTHFDGTEKNKKGEKWVGGLLKERESEG